jgi:hypothetical protein
MSSKKLLYGKVFVSHSSLDKPFVRKLAKALEADGFRTWLDEKELLPGDSLAQRVSEGVLQASAVIVVVSKAAITSKWLAFELNKATGRMVDGECLVIPVVIDSVRNLPSEVQGLLYADFSASFKRPMRAVLNALNRDVEVRVTNTPFYLQVNDLLDEIFDGRGSSRSLSEYRSDDEELIYVKLGTDAEQAIAYETLSAYGDDPRPFTDLGVSDVERALTGSTEALRLIVSERPIAATFPSAASHPKIHVLPIGGTRDPDGYVVFADFSSAPSESERQEILKSAKSVLVDKAKELLAARQNMRARRAATRRPI